MNGGRANRSENGSSNVSLNGSENGSSNVSLNEQENRSANGRVQNAEINFLKLIFAIVVFLYHYTLHYNFGLTYAGYITVDYFFVLSGIFLHRKVRKAGWKINPLLYAGRRYLQFLPFILYTFAMCVIIRFVQEGGFSFTRLFQWMYEARWELLCLSGLGLKSEWIFYPPMWFISSMILDDLVILLCYWFAGKRFDRAVFPIAAAIYVFFFLTLGHLRAEGDQLLFFTKGTWRGIAGLCLGLSADRWIAGMRQFLRRRNSANADGHHASGKAEKDIQGGKDTGKAGRRRSERDSWQKQQRIFRLIAWMLVVYTLYGHRLHPTTRLDYWFLAVMTIAMVLILSLDEPERLQTSRISLFAGRLSMAIYFNHNYLMELSFWESIRNPLVRAGVLSGAVLAASLLSLCVIGGLRLLWSCVGRRFLRRV